MSTSDRIKHLPLLYTDTNYKDCLKHIKFKRKLPDFGNLGGYIPFKNIHKLYLGSKSQDTKFRKNINILKTFAGVKSLKWINLVRNNDDLHFAYQLIKKYKNFHLIFIS